LQHPYEIMHETVIYKILFFGREKCVSDINFVGSRLFMGVMSILKYAVHTFQRQIVKKGSVLTDNESDNKVVYLQKWQHVIMLKK